MKQIFNIFRRAWAMAACVAIVASGCTVVLTRSLLGKTTRETTNNTLRYCGKKILRAVDATYKISFVDNFKFHENLPHIFMSNHMSLFDTPLFFISIDETIRVITKKELTRVPLMGKAIINSEQIIIDRKIPASSQNFYENAKEKLANGISIWIFPEGTRSKTGEMLPFKKGGARLAYEAGAQIIPVAIIGTDRILKSKKALPNLGEHIEIRFGQPIDARSYDTQESQQKLIEEVVNSIKTMRLTPLPS